MKMGEVIRFACLGPVRYNNQVHMETPAPVNLLFVDDDTSYMAVAQHLLSKYQEKKFSIIWRKDGISALEYLDTHPAVDMLLVDYYLPEQNGLEFIKAIREKGIALPVIFLTSNRDFKLAIEAMKYGVEDYLVKDEAVDSVLPRTILNILERIHLKNRILEQKKADLIARKRTEALKELVVTVCHEFNNPLAAVKISTDILLRHRLPAEEAEQVREIDRNIALMEEEITRLRDINFEKTGTQPD
jgi:CheY-like chemotaxis protein